MPWAPPEMQKVIDQVNNDQTPRVSVRELLRWFHAYRRGRHVVSSIRHTLRQNDLITEPDFNSTWIDGSVAFKRRGKEAAAPAPVVTTTAVSEMATDSGATGEAAAETPATNTVACLEGEATHEEAAPVVRTLDGQDPSYSVSKLEAANRSPVSVSPNATVREAVTIMLSKDYSQLPVMQGERSVKGLISWKSIGARLALGRKCDTVGDAMENVQTVSAEASIFQVAEIVARDELVLVRASATDNKIVGIVTTADVAHQFGSLGEPFLLIGEIENRIRGLIDGKFTLDELKAAKAPGDDDREIESVTDLTFGEYIWLLQNREHWAKCKLQIDRTVFIKRLDEVRDIRNDVMHFDPDGVGPEALENLRQFAQFLGRLVSLSDT